MAERRFNWQWWSACRGLNPAAFVPEPQRGGHRRPPLLVEALCGTCPVRDQCEQYGRDTGSVGWWGGVFLGYGDALCQPAEQPDLVGVAAAYRRGSVAAVMEQFHVGRTTAWRMISQAYAAGIAERRRQAPGRLTGEQVVEIRARYAAGGVLQRQLAAEYGVSRPRVTAVISDGKRLAADQEAQEIRACHSA